MNLYACRYSYSQDGEPTIIPKSSKKIKLGQASELSKIDRLKINKLYQCGQCQTSRALAKTMRQKWELTGDLSPTVKISKSLLSPSAGDVDDH